MDIWIERALTVLVTLIASSGFWAYFQRRFDKKDAKTRMIVGLGHDRIMFLAAHYIKRGWITQDEYEDLRKYLYDPYVELGGNGSAKRNMQEVDKLPIRPNGWTDEKEAELKAKMGG